jgi:uncharacterized protein (TIGR02246 family)
MPTPKPSAAHSKDATARVKSIVASLAESWNRHDMAAFAAGFCDDADFVNVIGMHWQGRQEIEAKHAQTHRTIFRNSVLQIVEVTVRFLSPSIALAQVSTELKGAESLRERVADIVPVPFPVGLRRRNNDGRNPLSSRNHRGAQASTCSRRSHAVASRSISDRYYLDFLERFFWTAANAERRSFEQPLK